MKRFLNWSFSRKTSKNSEEFCKYLVIPDLHGTYSVFKKIDEYIKANCEVNRKIIFLGDYMDRGESGEIYGKHFPDIGSYLIIRDLIKLKSWAKQNNRKIIFLRGNHEIFFEDYYFGENEFLYHKYEFFKNSIDVLEYAFKKEKYLYTDIKFFLKELKPYFLDKENKYLFIHAGIDPTKSTLEQQIKHESIYWIRDKFIYAEETFDFTVIFGHTPFEQPLIKLDRIGLDSGIYDSGYINLLKIDDKSSQILKINWFFYKLFFYFTDILKVFDKLVEG